jgi:hypothetical protein
MEDSSKKEQQKKGVLEIKATIKEIATLLGFTANVVNQPTEH